MSEQDEKFTLENLDHLSEEFAQGDSSLPEVRLLQDLQWAQKTHDRIVTRATERVWQRLQASEHLKEAATGAHSISSIPPPQSLTKNIRKGILSMNNLDIYGIRPQRRGRRFFAEVAAVLLVGIVASMFLLLTHYYHTETGHSGVQRSISTQNTQKASAPAFLYVTAPGGIVKLDKRTGKVLWTFHAPDWQPSHSPFRQGPATNITTSTENTVYVTNLSASISTTKTVTFTLHEYAINAQSGHLLWSYTSQGETAFSASVLSGNILYLDANTGVTIQPTGEQTNATGSALLALDVRNGHLLWHTQLKGTGGESLAVKNGLVYVSITNGGLNRTPLHGIEALYAQSGTPAWWTLTPGMVDPGSQSSFQVTDTLIYDITMEVSNKDVTVVHAYDALNGKVRWSSSPITGVTITGVTPVLSNGVLYFCANFGSEANNMAKIFALDATSGRQLQVYSLPLELYELLPIDGHVYLSYNARGGLAPNIYSGSGLLALDKTMTLGHHLWLDTNINGDNAFPSSLLLGNGLLYFLADNQVEAADAATGKIVWQQKLPDSINLP